MPFEDTTILKYLSTALDIAIVWFIIYKLILIIRGTKAVQLLKGITVIIVVKMISIFLELRTLSWLTEQINVGIFSRYYYLSARIAKST